MKLIEIFDSEDFIVETLELEKENKNVLAALHFPFILGDKKNANGRTYSSRILRREIERMQKRIAESGLPGQLDHPSFSGSTEITKISHLLTSVSWDEEKKKGEADAAILRTSKGRDLLVLLNSDVRMGASVRGRGSVDPNGFVQSDYCMESVDIVVNPSFGRDVEISSKNLLESGNQLFKQNFLSEEDAKIRFRFARLSGYKNSFSEFLKGLKILKE